MTPKRIQKIPAKYRKQVEAKLSQIAATLKQKREAAHMTQEEFAEELDISVITLQYIEQGRRFPSLPMLIYIFESLEINFQLK